jgi:hypothetical protein
MKKLKEKHLKFIKEAELKVGEGGVITRKQSIEVAKGLGMEQPNWLFNGRSFRHDRGVYRLPVVSSSPETSGTSPDSE